MDALRGVAQPGRASALGAECRQFESGYPDMKKDPLWVLFHILGSQISFTEGEARRASREVSEAKPKPAQPQNLPMIERSEIEWRILRYIEDVARRVRAARRSRIAARTIWLPRDA